MDTQLTETKSRKITVTVPAVLLARLDETISTRKRSLFIAQAIEEKLALEEQLAAIEETAGAWTNENHPEMAADTDIDEWLLDVRTGWQREPTH